MTVKPFTYSLILLVSVWSSLCLWPSTGQTVLGAQAQIDETLYQDGDVTLIETPFQDLSTVSVDISSEFEDGSTVPSAADNATAVLEDFTQTETILISTQRPILGDNSNTDHVFLWTANQEDYPSEEKALQGYIFMTISEKKTLDQCAFECLKTARCLSVNFYSASYLCELSNSSHAHNPESLANVQGSEYHARSTFSIDRRALGPCASNPCFGNSRCLETKSVSGDSAHLCLCERGWAGSDCSLKEAGPQWGSWSHWGECSVSCNRGWRMRTRNCEDSTKGKTLSAGHCYGASQEYGTCELQECPRWEAWGAWGECSTQTTCGSGVKVRQRACSNGGVVGVDRYCLGLANESTPCHSVPCIGPMRLSGGSVPGEGRVEIYDDQHNQWSLVCADQMTQALATMICRQVGWPGGHAAITDGRFGSGSGKFGLTSVSCKGSELTLAACEHNKWTSTGICNGGATLAAGVQCNVNGVWSLWTPWSQCSVSCQNGIQTRTRQCNHPARQHGGKDCHGESIQTKKCTLDMCPVDGVWEAWGPWDACSVSCGNGTQSRRRGCHGPFYGGKGCQGEADQTRDCMDKHCPVDGVWENWTEWAQCSQTCAGGTRTRDRNCTGPFYDGRPCEGASQEEETCNTQHCPVDGVWLQWGAWGPCSETCAGGTRSRVRACKQPLYGGVSCSGLSQQTEDCNLHKCPIDGVWRAWAEWSECSVTCGNGTQTRNRTCDGPYHLGKDCEGGDEETQMCMPSICPVNGKWLSWTNWSTCSKSCGTGTQERVRVCDGPYFGGDNCTGPDQENRDCNTQHCPVDGKWQAWSEWSMCSMSCGGGNQSRVRECLGPFYGGLACDGPMEMIRACNTNSCPEDGIFNPWSEWTECGLSCGGGIRERYRTCEGPYFGGKDCDGPTSDMGTCNEQPCPINGVFMEWSDWSSCSVSCGGGVANRSRECDGPKYGGKDCEGPMVEQKSCNENSCPVNGVFMEWSDWSSCSVSCGGGVANRSRECDGPKYGGKDCEGPMVEQKSCNENSCPVNGVFMEWSDWSSCSVSCGGGVANRSRECDGPKYGGKDCEGPMVEQKSCNENSCPVNGVFMEWSDWSSCSVSCGGGVANRSRECDGPKYGGKDCEGPMVEQKSCNENSCPVNGVFMEWSDWSSCSVSCGGGVANRSRECDGPKYGGKDCEGPMVEQKSCNENSCPVNGVFMEWSDWSSCSVSCGGGVANRSRECDGPKYGGKDCEGPMVEQKSCNENSCPVNGVFMEWSDWSSCSVSCGGGVANRSRECDGPKYGGKDCEGPMVEQKSCNENSCPEDGAWLPWSGWSECSETCGGGQQARNRSCVGTSHGGDYCQGDHHQLRTCNTQNCPIDGVWNPWSGWDECSVTCGGGFQARNRTCDGPYYKGLDCQGDEEQNQTCNTQPCPIDGYYRDWSVWSQCSVTCGGGAQSRDRLCVQPQHGGQDCQGPGNETQDCNTQPCPVDGVYLDWSAWGECSASCGGGHQWRNRTCQPPQHGGQDCEGPDNVTQTCNTQPCPIDGVWLDWTDWSVCTVTCGGGMSSRSRQCHPPQHGGQPCLGSAEETRSCAETPCPIPGDWFEWTDWTLCGVTCGGGVRYRQRECDTESYGNLTAPCQGLATESEPCHDFPCSPLAATCSELAEKGLRESSIVDIDVDGPGIFTLEPIQVYCDMDIDGGVGVTVVGHDQEDRMMVQGLEAADGVRLNYNISFDHVLELVDRSASCKQYISWECFAALIHNKLGQAITGWLTREQDIADYFGGAAPGSRSCACGMNSSCVVPELKCNCDANDEVWRQDDGFLTYKDDLPVYAFMAGDTDGKNENGYKQIGPLLCQGKETRTFNNGW